MTKGETIKILTFLASNYESIDKKMSDEEKSKIIIDTWHSCIGDLDYKLVAMSVKKHMLTSKYPPTINDIRESCLKITSNEEKTAMEYWQEAFAMMSAGSAMTVENFQECSELCKKFFGSLARVRDYGMMDRQDVLNNVQPRFIKFAESYKKQDYERKMLPDSFNELVSKLASNMDLKQIGGNNEI